MPQAVLLVDGVGNAVIVQRANPELLIIDCAGRRFERMREYQDGMDIYRLAGTYRVSAEGLWPEIRHIFTEFRTVS